MVDGQLVAAAQEERFTRKKHDHNFPKNAVDYCLREAKIQPEDLDYVVFYDKPLLKFERLLETYLAFAPQGLRSFLMAMPLWLKTKLHLPREIKTLLDGRFQKDIVFTGHHESHAASAFSPRRSTRRRFSRWTAWANGPPSASHRQRQQHRTAARWNFRTLSACFTRIHLLHGLQGQFRRIQTHGSGALWRAEICGPHSQASRQTQAGRLFGDGQSYFDYATA